MKKLKDELKSIQKSLVSLSKKVGKLSTQVEKIEAAKAAKKAAPKKKAAVKKAAPAKAKKAAAGKSTVLDTVLDVVKKNRAGATIAKLKEKTGLDSRQLSNAIYRLSKRGMIKKKGTVIKSKNGSGTGDS